MEHLNEFAEPPKKKSKTQCCFECQSYVSLCDELCMVCQTKYMMKLCAEFAEKYFGQ